MPRDGTRPSRDRSGNARDGGARRLIAGLRITRQDEALLDVVRPLLPEAASEGELAYRLWRRGLEVTAAEAVSLGVVLPAGITEELLASLVAQRLLLSVPLLRRTGKLALLGMETSTPRQEVSLADASVTTDADTSSIDGAVATAIIELGGSDFL